MPVVTRAVRRRGIAAIMCVGLLAVSASSLAAPLRRAFCARDGAGVLRVLVLMPPARWPAGGFRLSVAGQAAGRLRPDARASARLSAHDRQALRKLPARARSVKSSGAEVIIYGRLLSDWRFARAAGMGGVVEGAPRRDGAVSVVPLSRAGQGTGRALSCRIAAAGPPPAPAGLRGEMLDDGVALYWRRLPERAIPVLSFRVERDSEEGAEPITRQPPFLPFKRDETQPAFVDSLVPLEQDVTYQVRWVDALGRQGPAARVRVYALDHAALRPPAGIDVMVSENDVTLHWPKSGNRHTVGYVVERAYLSTGPYEVLTPKGIPADKPRYRDRGLQGGTRYFYRVRSMGPRGDLGAPSDPVAAQARSRDAPPAPTHLKADAGRTRVRLRWEPVGGNVAGYIVERRAKGSAHWSRLNQTLLQPPRYDDQLGPQTGGILRYRVTAVSQDNRVSHPSRTLTVHLLDSTPPLAPSITAAEGGGGQVVLRLRAARPTKDTARIYVLRGGSADDPGLVLGEPLPGGAHQFVDTWVQPGQVYWYHLVAYDRAGNRSADGQAVEVRVGAPTLERPPKPSVHFVKEPIPRVSVRFKPPRDHVAVLVESTRDGEHWLTVAGPTKESSAIDAGPGSGAVRYRVRYRSDNGRLGPPSPAATVNIP